MKTARFLQGFYKGLNENYRDFSDNPRVSQI